MHCHEPSQSRPLEAQTAVTLWRRDLDAMAGVLTHYMPTSQGPESAGCPWGQPGQAAAAGEGVQGVQGMQLHSLDPSSVSTVSLGTGSDTLSRAGAAARGV